MKKHQFKNPTLSRLRADAAWIGLVFGVFSCLFVLLCSILAPHSMVVAHVLLPTAAAVFVLLFLFVLLVVLPVERAVLGYQPKFWYVWPAGPRSALEALIGRHIEPAHRPPRALLAF